MPGVRDRHTNRLSPYYLLLSFDFSRSLRVSFPYSRLRGPLSRASSNDAVIVTGGSYRPGGLSPVVLLVLTRVNSFFFGLHGRSWTRRAIKIHEPKEK
jgi:hypothetical protein